MVVEFRVDGFEAFVHQLKSLVDSFHSRPHIARTFLPYETAEETECLHLAFGSVEEGRSNDVHALHVECRVTGVFEGPGVRVQDADEGGFGDVSAKENVCG